MKIRKLVVLGLAGVMMVAFTACGGKTIADSNQNGDVSQTGQNQNTESTPEVTTNSTENQNKETTGEQIISITGSTSVEKILVDMIEEYQALNPDITIQYVGTGSSAGIADTLAKSNTMGVVSREVKEEEKTDDLQEVAFSYDGIAVAVHPSNPITDLSIENIAKIYSGEVKNWNQVGGNDAEIVVVSREGASGTRSAFEELVGLEEAGGLTESASVVEGNGNIQSSVAGNENAIGYVSFSYIDDTVKAITVDGVEATAENAKAGSYLLSRPFLFVYLKSTLPQAASDFIDFALSSDGQAFVENHGGIKVD